MMVSADKLKASLPEEAAQALDAAGIDWSKLAQLVPLFIQILPVILALFTKPTPPAPTQV